MKFHSFLLLLAAAIASCALVLSSCGSGNSESSNDIKVSEIASWDAGVKAYFKWLDGEGGIDGKLVTLISKDDGEDPAKTRRRPPPWPASSSPSRTPSPRSATPRRGPPEEAPHSSSSRASRTSVAGARRVRQHVCHRVLAGHGQLRSVTGPDGDHKER